MRPRAVFFSAILAAGAAQVWAADAATLAAIDNCRAFIRKTQLDDGAFRFALKGDAPLCTGTPLNDDQWHHVLTTVGPGGQRLYVDGRIVATGRLAGRTHTSNRLGLDLGPGGDVAVVSLDEVRVYGRAMPPDGAEGAAR